VKRDTKIIVVLLVAIGVIAVAKSSFKGSSVVLLLAVVPSIILHEVSPASSLSGSATTPPNGPGG
jgi:hypothetical protein